MEAARKEVVDRDVHQACVGPTQTTNEIDVVLASAPGVSGSSQNLDLAQTNALSRDARSCGGSVGKVTSSVRRLLEFLRADMASAGASLTVIHGVLGTFFAARLADLYAQLAHLRHEFASAGHETSRDPADRSTVHVESDASGHHVCVGLLQARDRAVVTGFGAGIASVDAAFIHLVIHGGSFQRTARRALQTEGTDIAQGIGYSARKSPNAMQERSRSMGFHRSVSRRMRRRSGARPAV